MGPNLQLGVQSSSSKGRCSLVRFNAAFNLFQLNFDQALFVSTPLLICCNFDNSLVAMCIIEFVASHSLELEFLEDFQPLSDLYRLKEGRDDVPIAGHGELELSNFKEIQNLFLVTAKVEQTSVF